MSALITIAVLVFVALWASASYARLLRLRRMVKNRWREVTIQRRRRDERRQTMTGSSEREADVSDADRAWNEARQHYNTIAAAYNHVATTPPSSLIARAAGFKRAELLPETPEPENPRT